MSFYTSLNGLRNAQTDLSTISHNIANAETTGFKRSRVEFADIVAGSAFTNPRLIQGLGAAVEAINQNFTNGPIEQTGSALDVAINGDGFFTTRSAANGQILFTRNGSFALDGAGAINDGSGNYLQGFAVAGGVAGGAISTTAGNIQVPPTNPNSTATPAPAFAGLTIAGDGSVIASYADGSNYTVAMVALASFVAPGGLKQVGSSNWEATGVSGAPAYGVAGQGQFGDLLSGALERSNVDIAEELVGLITAQRNFQANAKAIDTATQISQTIINLRS